MSAFIVLLGLCQNSSCCIHQDISIFCFATKVPYNFGEHGEFSRPSLHSKYHVKMENTHIFANIGDHQASAGLLTSGACPKGWFIF